MLCSIKRPLKIHFAFGNNNKISVSIPGSGVRLAIFCLRVFCHPFNGDGKKFDRLRLKHLFSSVRHNMCVRAARVHYLTFLFNNLFIYSPNMTFPLQMFLKHLFGVKLC